MTRFVIQREILHSLQIKAGYGPDLDTLAADTSIGVLVDDDNALHLYVNDVDQGVAAPHIPPKCHVIVDVYGVCEQVSIVTSSQRGNSTGAQQSAEYALEKANMEEGELDAPYICVGRG